MAFLVDTSILVRLVNRADPAYTIADRAVVELHQRGELLHITPQVLIEFRSVATRPAVANGLGIAANDAEKKAAEFETLFPVLPDSPAIFIVWKSLVAAVGVIGKQVHDARLAAVCHVHGVDNILTFNVAHFSALAAFGTGLTIVHPTMV